MSKNVVYDALFPIYQELNDLVGEEKMLKIYGYWRGSQISLPMRLYNPKQLRPILKASRDSNKDLARLYGYSERWVRDNRR
ncbi:Mor transcription activator family protein [Levilactobacillus yiduensis]|uniref:Mor transcription activator family protein n=1 Tax=Levilactobacillus yiduensis TaxID=2953880 RepID=UPI000EF2FDB5|nr:Mor transcription activator family protein [Levilactobacillus yiduensis]AYM01484.1 Mor transcription activator family protein [Levilactobacillus brevis]